MSPNLRYQIQKYLKPTLQFVSYVLYVLIPLSYLVRGGVLMDLGRTMGEYALYLLWVTLIPGILKRFRVKGLLLDIQIILMGVRRQLGILVFLCASAHFTWQRLFLYLDQGIPGLSMIPTFELLGMLALFLLSFLYLTSNDFSVKRLGRNWGRIHALVYIIIWIIALHVILIGGEHIVEHGLPTIALGLTQIASYVYKWRNTGSQINPPAGGQD